MPRPNGGNNKPRRRLIFAHEEKKLDLAGRKLKSSSGQTFLIVKRMHTKSTWIRVVHFARTACISVALQKLICDSLWLNIAWRGAKRHVCRIVFRRITLVLCLITWSLACRHERNSPYVGQMTKIKAWERNGRERKRERGRFSFLFYPLMCNCTRSGAVTHVGQEEE